MNFKQNGTLLLMLAYGFLGAQTVSQFDFEDAAFDEKIATIGPNALSSGSLANARATGNGTPQGCAAGVNAFGSGGCFTAGGCPQNINMIVPNTGNLFNVTSPTMSIDYRRPIREIDGWFWLKDQLAFGVRFSKMTARYAYDAGLGTCSAQIEFAAYPPAWNWPVNGGWTWGGAVPANGEIPPDGVWRTYSFSYDQASGVASITISNPAHTEYSTAVAGRAFCGWTAANMGMFPNMDNGATGANNTTAFLDNARYGQITTLPVVLNYFKGEQEGYSVSLQWETAKEIQNDHFILYRSVDAENWHEIAQVDGRGSTENSSAYSFTDLSPLKGLNYYRLVQVDKNGATAGFPAIEVKMDYTGTGLMNLFPNPVTQGVLHAQFDGKTEGESVSIQILDMEGRLVLGEIKPLAIGINDLEIQVQDLPPGMYIARFSNHGRVGSEKFIITENP